MTNLLQQIREAWRYMSEVNMGFFRIQDLLDLLLLTFLIYKAIQLVRDTRAYQLLKGIAFLVVAYGAAWLLGLEAMTQILRSVFNIGILALLVVFQPELRRSLERVGRTRLGQLANFSPSEQQEFQTRMLKNIDGIYRACNNMQQKKTGALIIIERSTMIGDLMRTGTQLDAEISEDLLCSIFYPNSPLHDGAVIIRQGRVLAAGCILPLTQMPLEADLGTRHRAAIGVSENSDAIALVVSEESGAISFAVDGELTRGINITSLHALLEYELITKEMQNTNARKFWKKGAKYENEKREKNGENQAK